MAQIVVKQKVKDVNEFNFTGYIVGKRENRKTLTIFFRTNTKEGNRSYLNNMTILVFDDEAKKKFNSVSLREKVSVSGFIRTRVERDEYGRPLPPVSRAMYERKQERERQEDSEKPSENERPYRSGQYFVATDVIQVSEDVEDENIIYVTGSVDSTSVTPRGMIRFTIRTAVNGISNITLLCSPKKDVDYLTLMRARGKVRIKAHCGSRAESTDSGVEYTENYIIDEIEKA